MFFDDFMAISSLSATAKDVYSQQFNTVLENDAASRCLEGFKKGMPPVLAVLDDKGLYVGMVSRRSILRIRTDLSRIKVKSVMSVAPEVSLGDSLSRVAKLMIGSGVRQLPVFEKNKIIGFITDEAVIHAVVGDKWGNSPVDSVMTRAPHTMEANRSVGAVLGLMREFGVSHVPIMDKGKLAGLVSVQDILENVYYPPKRMGNNDVAGDRIDNLGIAAKGIMSAPAITVDPKKSLRDCEALMHSRDISCLCVVDGDRLVGVVTKLDFLEPISQLETAERRFTVQFGLKDVDISPEQQEFMMTEFDSFSRRFPGGFPAGFIICVHEESPWNKPAWNPHGALPSAI